MRFALALLLAGAGCPALAPLDADAAACAPEEEICSDGIDQDCDGLDLSPCPAIDVESVAEVLTAPGELGIWAAYDFAGGGVFLQGESIYAWTEPVMAAQSLAEADWILTPGAGLQAIGAIGEDGDLACAHAEHSVWLDVYRYHDSGPYLTIGAEWATAHVVRSAEFTGDGIADVVYEGAWDELLLVVDGSRSGAINAGEEDARIIRDADDEDLIVFRPLGDTNGDGFDDVAVVSPWDTVRIFRGPLVGTLQIFDEDAAVVGESRPTVAAGGDLDGDGLPDVMIANGPYGAGVGVYALVEGGAIARGDEFATVACEVACGPIVGGLNLDDDAAADFVISGADEDGNRAYWLYRGPVAGFVSVSGSSQRVAPPPTGASGQPLPVASDLDDDGLDDLVFPAGSWMPSVYVVSGDLLW